MSQIDLVVAEVPVVVDQPSSASFVAFVASAVAEAFVASAVAEVLVVPVSIIAFVSVQPEVCLSHQEHPLAMVVVQAVAEDLEQEIVIDQEKLGLADR